jgi:hypothetical protein
MGRGVKPGTVNTFFNFFCLFLFLIFKFLYIMLGNDLDGQDTDVNDGELARLQAETREMLEEICRLTEIHERSRNCSNCTTPVLVNSALLIDSLPPPANAPTNFTLASETSVSKEGSPLSPAPIMHEEGEITDLKVGSPLRPSSPSDAIHTSLTNGFSHWNKVFPQNVRSCGTWTATTPPLTTSQLSYRKVAAIMTKARPRWCIDERILPIAIVRRTTCGLTGRRRRTRGSMDDDSPDSVN